MMSGRVSWCYNPRFLLLLGPALPFLTIPWWCGSMSQHIPFFSLQLKSPD